MAIQENVKNIMERTQANGEVLHNMKTKRSLLNTIKKRKCQYFGHIIRGDGVHRFRMERRINGRRGRGRPRTNII